MSNVDIAHALYDALEAGDVAGFRAMFSDDAIVWHNFDNIDQTIDEALAALGGMAQLFSSLQYTNRRYLEIDGGAILQHNGVSTLHDGRVMDSPIMQRIYISNGKVTRVEEYLDSAPMAALMAEQQA